MILGIDPGLVNTGWGVLQSRIDKDGFELVRCGVIETKKPANSFAVLAGREESRIKQIYDELDRIIKKYGVTELAYEKLYFAKNSISAMAVAEVIGVIKLCGAKNEIEVTGFTPLEVKMTITGFGRAGKEQVEEMVRRELRLEEPIKPSHAADAAAVALTAGFRMRVD